MIASVIDKLLDAAHFVNANALDEAIVTHVGGRSGHLGPCTAQRLRSAQVVRRYKRRCRTNCAKRSNFLNLADDNTIPHQVAITPQWVRVATLLCVLQRCCQVGLEVAECTGICEQHESLAIFTNGDRAKLRRCCLGTGLGAAYGFLGQLHGRSYKRQVSCKNGVTADRTVAKQNAVRVGNQPSVTLCSRSRSIRQACACASADRTQGSDDVGAHFGHCPKLQHFLACVTKLDACELLVVVGDSNSVTDCADFDLVTVVAQRFFVAFQQAVSGYACACQFGDKWNRNAVASLLGQVRTCLDDAVFGCAHIPLEAVCADVRLEKVCIPYFFSI